MLLFLSFGIILFFSGNLIPLEWMDWSQEKVLLGAEFPALILFFLFLIIGASPLPILLLGGPTSLEFLFTRAIDRRKWLRAEHAVILILIVGPLLVNLMVSLWRPDLSVEPGPAGSGLALRQAQYLKIFSGSHLSPKMPGEPQLLIIRHGAEMFAAWLVWFGTLTIFLAAGYFTVVFRAWQRGGWHHSKSPHRNWLGALMLQLPTWGPLLVVTALALLRINIFEVSFLLFARDPWMLTAGLIALIFFAETLGERNIQKLEFEFL